MDHFDKNRYLFLVKLLSGWTSYSWEKFFNRYPEIKQRISILETSQKGYLYDNDNFRNLSEEEGVELLINVEFIECETFIEWEFFIQAYKDTHYKDIINDALGHLKRELLDTNLLIRLKKYKDLFPEGIFINEVRIKILVIQKELEKADHPELVKEIGEVEKREIFNSVNKGKSKIVYEYLGVNQQVDIDFDVINFIETKKKEIGFRDIEKILSEAVRIFNDLDLDRNYSDKLIVISAEYREFRFKQTANILSLEDESVIYSTIIDRIIKLFNLILDDFKPV